MRTLTEILIYRTSPETLKNDIKMILERAELNDNYRKEKKVLIKVNANYDKFYPGCNTSPWFLDALLSVLKKFGFNNLAVIEGDLKLQPAERTIQRTGLRKVIEKHNITFVNIDKCVRGMDELPTIIYESQLINVPVIHTHTFAVISCACKNLFGLLPIHREKYHNILSEKILEIYGKARPCFTVVDGTVGLDGGSMRMGDPRRLDLILAGWDALAIDVAVARLVGFSIEEIPLLKIAEVQGLLSKEIKVKGDYSYENMPCYNFRYKKSKMAEFDLWLRKNSLTKNLFRHNSIFDKIAHYVRRTLLSINYRIKEKKILNGPWTQYTKLISSESQ